MADKPKAKPSPFARWREKRRDRRERRRKGRLEGRIRDMHERHSDLTGNRE
jgi:hypothetical protein